MASTTKNIFNPLLKKNIQQLTVVTGNTIFGYVATYADLPLGTTSTDPVVDDVVGVRTGTGVWGFGRKSSGFYRRIALTGVIASDWVFFSDFTDAFSDSHFVVYNSSDTTKQLVLDTSTIATATTRTLTIPNRNIDLGAVLTNVVITTPGVIFTTPVSNSTTLGVETLNLTLVTQTANTIFAGPTTGSAATPTFRSLVAADIPTLSYFTLPTLTAGSVLYSNGTTIVQDNANFYFASHLLSVNVNADFTGTDSINIYKMIDSFTLNASDNGYSASHSRGTASVPTSSLANDYIGIYGFYPYTSSWVEGASMRAYAEGASTTDVGTRLEFWTKVNAGVLTKALVIDSTQSITTGIWKATLISPTYGGTGVNNGANTFTYGANTTISGGGTISLGGFTLTVPATGTAALLATANVFTANQALTLSTNIDLVQSITNSNASGAARSNFSLSNGTSLFNTVLSGTGYTTAGLLTANQALINTTGAGILYSAFTSGAYHRWAIGGTAAGNQIMNLLTTGLSLTPTTLTDGTNALSVTATMPTTIAGTNNAVNINVTSAGSSSQANRAMLINYGSGYTGSSNTVGLAITNGVAGTGNNLLSGLGNFGFLGTATATTTGYNYGASGTASNGNLNAAFRGLSIVAKNSATNIGGAFFGNNTGTSPIQIGVYAGLNTTDPTFVSAALLVDNAAASSPISLFRANGTVAVTIDSVGNLQLNTVGNGLYIKEGTNATMGTGTLVAGTLTVSTTKVTANSRIFLTDTGGGVLANIGSLYISARSAGTSFTVSSSNALDTSTFNWIIIEPA